MRSSFKPLLAAFLAFSPLFLSPLSVFAQADVRPLLSTQQELESEINSSVDSLIAQSRALTERLLSATERLETASNEAEELKAERNALSISLENTSKSLNESKTRIIELSQSLKAWKRACMTAFTVLMGLILIVGVVLYLELTKKTDFI